MSNIYTYVDYTGFLSEVFESSLNFAGDWRSTAHYYRFDVVTYGAARYVCTTANINSTPPFDLQFNQFWSIIAFTSTGTGSSGTNTGGGGGGGGVDNTQMVQDVYSLAYRAYNIALTGTTLPTPGSVAPWVLQWIGHTYNIARAGTDAAHSADMWGRDAFSIAVNGTNAANAANSYAGQAWTIAVAGTTAASVAQSSADAAYSLARQALTTAWTGTDLPTATTAKWVMDWIGQTYNLATAGTTAASSADSWARDAYGMAVTGTNAASAAQAAANSAYSLATTALNTAWAGTSASALAPWVVQWIGQTYNLAVAGTNAANSADTWGRDAFSLAVAGTNAAAAAQATANTALALAGSSSSSSGTVGRALVLCAGYTPVTIGPDVAEVPVPYSPDDGVTAFTWQVKRASVRVQTAGGAPWVIIEKSNGTGVFSAVSVGTISLASGAYEGSVTSSLGTVTSGDKMRFNVGTLATALNWTIVTEISK